MMRSKITLLLLLAFAGIPGLMFLLAFSRYSLLQPRLQEPAPPLTLPADKNIAFRVSATGHADDGSQVAAMVPFLPATFVVKITEPGRTSEKAVVSCTVERTRNVLWFRCKDINNASTWQGGLADVRFAGKLSQ